MSNESRSQPVRGGLRVLVWRRELLARSETFIKNQAESVTRFDPILGGVKRLPNSLPLNLDSWTLDERPGLLAHRSFNFSRRSRGLESLVRDTAPAVIHAHFGFDGSVIVPLATRMNIPLVVTFHGHDVTALPQESTIYGRLYRSRLRELFDRAVQLIAVSEFIADRLRSLGAPAEKILVLYIGVPRFAPPTQTQLRDGVLFVGRLVDKKGVEDLLEAVSRLPGSTRDVRVRVIGDGRLRSALEERARRLNVRAEFLGALRPDEIRLEMLKASVFCAPSKVAPTGDAEGFGLVFAEAGSCGLPVAAYEHGGVREAVGHNTTGLLASEGDIDQLSQNIHCLLADPAMRMEFGAAAVNRVSQKFDLTAQTAKLERVYDRVL